MALLAIQCLPAATLKRSLRSLLPVFLLLLLLYALPQFCLSQQPQSDPRGVAYAAQAIAALTGNTIISDVTLTGTVSWNGPGADTGTATLRALGTNESRMDLALSSGTRTEIRDAQTGVPLGEWINPNTASGYIAPQNCWTDGVWFFPALGSLADGHSVVLSYIGQETRNGSTIQHLRSYQYVSGQFPSPTPQLLSVMDFHLDGNTFLPVAITFNSHPDADATTDLSIEVDFSNYQNVGSVVVPMHIQRYQQGNLLVDITVTAASFNTGLQLSLFAVN
jgi:hypothetical protein